MGPLLLLLASFTCPSDQTLSGLDLKDWKAALLAAAPGSDEQHFALAALRFKPVPYQNAPEADCIEKPKVEGVDIFDAPLTEAGGRLVQARFRMCKGSRKNEFQSLRIAVLVPLPGGDLCLLDGEDLSVDQSASDKPCEKPGRLPRTVGFAEVVEKGRKVIEVNDQHGSCGDPQGSSSSTRLSLYEAQGWSLKKIFDTDTWSSTTTAGGRQLVQRWKVGMGKELPKQISVQRCVEGASTCDDPDGFAYAKAGGKYLRK